MKILPATFTAKVAAALVRMAVGILIAANWIASVGTTAVVTVAAAMGKDLAFSWF